MVVTPRPHGLRKEGTEAAHRSDAQTWPPPAACPVQSAPGDIQDGPFPTGRPTFQSCSRQRRPKPGSDPQPRDRDRTGRGGAGWPGRGGDAVARAGGRASGRALCGSGGAEAAAPLGSARLRSGCSGSRAGSAGRDPANRTTSPSSLPAGPRFPEGTRSQVLLLVFLPSLPLSGCEPDAAAAAVAPVPPLARAERAVCASRGPGRRGRAGSGAGSGPRRWGGRGVARAPETKLAGCCSVSSSSPLRAQGDRSVLNAGSGPGALSFLA